MSDIDIIRKLEVITCDLTDFNKRQDIVTAIAEITRLNAIIKENEADKWISVEDRFPERIEGNKILCFSNDYIFECVYEDDNWCNIFGETFTHWQPLLQPPAMRVKGE